MGWDTASHQLFAGDDPAGFRARLLDRLDDLMAAQGYVRIEDPNESDRALAIGPAERWLCLYDSAGTGDNADAKVFTLLALGLSEAAPVVDIHISDSAAVHLHLFRDGSLADRYGNISLCLFPWDTPEVRWEYRGRAELWSDLTATPDRLAAAWREDYGMRILMATAEALGWNRDWCEAGYTVDIEGIPQYFREFFEGHGPEYFTNTSGFEERYYRSLDP